MQEVSLITDRQVNAICVSILAVAFAVAGPGYIRRSIGAAMFMLWLATIINELVH